MRIKIWIFAWFTSWPNKWWKNLYIQDVNICSRMVDCGVISLPSIVYLNLCNASFMFQVRIMVKVGQQNESTTLKPSVLK